MMNEILTKYPFLNDYNNKNQGAGIKRLHEITQVLEVFQTIVDEHLDTFFDEKVKLNSEKVKTIENANYILCEEYYKNVKNLKEYISDINGKETTINIFKIISTLEFSVCQVRPFISINKNEIIERKINGNFAFFLGHAFLSGWFKDEYFDFSFEKLKKEEEESKNIVKLINEHIDWLSLIEVNPTSIPSIPNSHFWWALKLLLSNRND